jgi:hypothetical protein
VSLKCGVKSHKIGVFRKPEEMRRQKSEINPLGYLKLDTERSDYERERGKHRQERCSRAFV